MNNNRKILHKTKKTPQNTFKHIESGKYVQINEEYKYPFHTLTLNSLSVTDTTPPRKQTNIAVTRSFIIAIVTIEQRRLIH